MSDDTQMSEMNEQFSNGRGGDGAVIITGEGLETVVINSGSTIWVVPEGVTAIDVIAIGGGGGSGEAFGGDAGEVSPPTRINVTPGDRFWVEIGAGGGPGEDGGATLFRRTRPAEGTEAATAPG